MCGQKCPTDAALGVIRAEYNLDKPFIVQYLIFVKNAFTGDFGKTFSGRSVDDIIAGAFPNTLFLALLAVVFEIIIGVGIGIWVGMRKGGIFDSTVLVFTLVLISIPTFVLGFISQLYLGMRWHVAFATVGDNIDIAHMWLPALVLASSSIAYVCRLTRSSVQANLSSDHVRTARAKGLSMRRVSIVHVLRNSLIPVVTYVGGDLAVLLGGAVLTEAIFNIKGIGYQLYQGIQLGEGPLVVSIITLMVIVYIISNILIDILYAVLDPRIRHEK
jgi:oligopeptide transport system permease protein